MRFCRPLCVAQSCALDFAGVDGNLEEFDHFGYGW